MAIGSRLGSGLAALLLAAGLGCAPGAPSANSSLTIENLQADTAVYLGQTVNLSGVFRGWQGRCLSPPPVARGDWMLEDETGCLYVHGALPAGLDPAHPRGEPLALEGVVRTDSRGVPYLDLGGR